VAFGPKPRDYSYALPKKIKRLAYRSVLSLKNGEGNLKVIENLEIKDGKTKELYMVVKPVLLEEKSVLVVTDKESDLMVKRAARNIKWLRCMSYNRMNVHDLYYAKNILLTEDAAGELNSFFGTVTVEAPAKKKTTKTSEKKAEEKTTSKTAKTTAPKKSTTKSKVEAKDKVEKTEEKKTEKKEVKKEEPKAEKKTKEKADDMSATE
jgi:Mg-chelatase subunit ChlI